MQSPAWYLNRLRRMSAAELGHRGWRAVRDAAERLAVPASGAPPFSLGNAGNSPGWISIAPGIGDAPYRDAADRIGLGRHSIFEIDDADLGRPPAWNRDPATGTVAPLRNAVTLDYRDPRLVGDIKYLWEPNRHLHLVTLAQAYALTRNGEYAEELGRQLESWLQQCPYPLGPNWTSSLELGIRLINWSACWQLLDLAPPAGPAIDRVRRAWAESAYVHARHVMRNLSAHSSANNHLIGEAAGVYVAATTWPLWDDMSRWRRRCKAILLEQALLQNAPDGGNREQAVSYQQFVLDFLLISGLAARAVGDDFEPRYWARIEAMVDFLASLMDVGGNVPMIGDADDGLVVRLAPGPVEANYRSLVATGAVLFGRADLAAKAGRFDDKSRWICQASGGEERFRSLLGARKPYRPARELRDSGYFVLGRDFEMPDEVRLTVDAGPLGYLSLAAHGHADMLAVVLSVRGQEILIDPGTFCYHTDPTWRRYFRGTPAHNTVCIDGADQSVQGGNFLWSRHARIRDLEVAIGESGQRVAASHDGYLRLRDGVLHRREVRFDRSESSYEIIDTIECKGSHRVMRSWHFAERLEPVLEGSTWRMQAGRAVVSLTSGEPLTRSEALFGSVEPPGGWVSRAFGRREPTKTLRWHNEISGPAVLRTRIDCKLDGQEAAGAA